MAVEWKKIAYHTDELLVAEQEVVGRLTGGNLDGIALGIADNNVVQIDGTTNQPVSTDYAKFTASGLEGRSYSEVLTDVGAVPKTLFDAQTILAATTDDTPAALTVTEQTLVGRITAGNIAALSVAQLQTLILSAALPENVAIILDPAIGTTEKYSGIVEVGTAGYTTAIGDLMYLKVGDSEWYEADADSKDTAIHKLGVALTVSSDGNPVTVLLWGKVRVDAKSWALVVGSPCFISTTAGEIVDIANIPTGTGEVIRLVGYGNTANELFFCPSNEWSVLA